MSAPIAIAIIGHPEKNYCGKFNCLYKRGRSRDLSDVRNPCRVQFDHVLFSRISPPNPVEVYPVLRLSLSQLPAPQPCCTSQAHHSAHVKPMLSCLNRSKSPSLGTDYCAVTTKIMAGRPLRPSRPFGTLCLI
jgi:hypothetical protein